MEMYRALRHKPSENLRKLIVVLKTSWPANQVLHGAGTQVNAVCELQLAPLSLAQDTGSGLCAHPQPLHHALGQSPSARARTLANA